ncbi:hypothetical protein AAG906_002654 [Vitis piasezkii]
MAVENTSSTILPFNTMIHMVTIKLSSSNYLLWKSQLLPLLESQELLGHVDGTLAPPPQFASANSQTPNIKHLAWKKTNQRILSLLPSSLTEEAMAEVMGLSTSCEKSLDNHGPPIAAFTTTNHGQPHSVFRNQSRHQSGRHSSSHRGNGRSNSDQGHRPPHCKICYQEGHYADKCNQRYARGGKPVGTTSNLADAFKASYYLNGPEPSDWYLDIGASTHMTPDLSHLDQASNYTGKDHVVVGNGASFSITHTVVPRLTKNLLSISKLTSDFPLTVTFTNNFFSFQNCQTRRVVATGKRDGGLYVLKRGNSVFISILKNKALHKPVWPSFSILIFLLAFGLTPSALQPTSSTVCSHRFSEGIILPTKVFAILIPPPLSFISPAMLNLMNTTFPPEMAPSMPHIDPPPMSSLHHSPLITPSGSNPCVICPDPMDKSLQVTDSLAGPSSPLLEPRPPPIASNVALTPAPPLGSHLMLTRAKTSIFKTHHPANLGVLSSSRLLSALLASINPTWLAAMDEEVQALQHNRTWVLVSRPAHTNIVGSKWVFRTKYLSDGSIERLKARLMAKGWPFHQLDVKNAFLNGTLTENVYMEQPPRYIDPRYLNHVCQLKKALYGLKQAPRACFARKLNSEFATKNLSSLSYFLSLEATSTTDGLFISQLKYPIHTLMIVSQHLTSNGPVFSDLTLYQSLVGALQYLTITRPDIAHVCILHYVKGTLHFGFTFCPSTGGCPNTCRSTFGYSIYLGDNLVSWSAKKQPTVSCSNCESEYRALATPAPELLWLTHLLHDLMVNISPKPILLCDNKSAIFLSSNPVSHKRAKHVELDYHFLRELVVAGKLRTQYVPSHLQVANLFTKSVYRPLFDFFRTKLHVCSNPTLSLRRGVSRIRYLN